MQAIDTNVLVFAEIRNSIHHDIARALLQELSKGSEVWAIPWPCVYEFLRVVTHPKVFHPPVPPTIALNDVSAILRSPNLMMLSETDRHSDLALKLIQSSGAKGNLIHDAHIAALCLEHGVRELITADRDFSRFEELRTSNPFVE